jgi:probable O-glycosylation ligase (exosortase A-associated)
MRDLVLLFSLFLIIPMMFRNTFAAFLFWGWANVIVINYYLYGFMQSFRLNFTVALLTLILVYFNKEKLISNVKGGPTLTILIVFVIQSVISAIFAYSPNPLNFDYLVIFIKAMAFCFLIPLLLTSKTRFFYFILVIATGLSFHGLLDGLKFLVTGGGHIIRGLGISMMSDNNHLAVALAMCLPLLLFIAKYINSKILSLGYWATFFMVTFSVVATRSRGAFITLAALGLWLILTSRNKLTILIVIIIASVSIVNIAPDDWFGRMKTIENASEDSSFMGRIIAWKISSAIALSNPLLGGGFHSIEAQSVWDDFKEDQGLLFFLETPPARPQPQSAHSVYFEVLGDHGILGLALFLGIIFSSFKNWSEISKVTKDRQDLLWARDMATSLGLSIIVYSIGGAAVSLAYFEPYYIVVLTLFSLRAFLEHEERLRLKLASATTD